MSFNMNRTWSQAVALMRGNFQLLAIIAGVFLLLPSLAVSVSMPDTLRLLSMGEDPEAVMAALRANAVPLGLYGLVSLLLQLVGYSAMVALIGVDRPTVGEAIMRGLRSLPSIVAAMMLFVLVYLAVVVVLSLLVAAITGALGAIGGGAVAGVIAVVLFGFVFVAVFFLIARLSLTLPVIVLEGVRNPVAALRRSFLVTRQSGWSIFAFYVLLAIAYFVISLLVLGVMGVASTALGDGPAAMLFLALVNAVIGALVAMVMSGILVSMHAQLAGGAGPAVGETLS